MSLPGWATTEGTANYRRRFEGRLSADHVGMKQISHVEENLKVAQLPPVPWEHYAKLFKASEKT